jgi:hypothetical protein
MDFVMVDLSSQDRPAIRVGPFVPPVRRLAYRGRQGRTSNERRGIPLGADSVKRKGAIQRIPLSDRREARNRLATTVLVRIAGKIGKKRREALRGGAEGFAGGSLTWGFGMRGMGETLFGHSRAGSVATACVEGWGNPSTTLAFSARTGWPWAKQWGRPFANRASTRPTLPQSVGSLGVIASTVPEKGTRVLMRTKRHIDKRLRFRLISARVTIVVVRL